MEKDAKCKIGDRYIVPVAGHTTPLYFAPGISSCGSIHDGVSFQFGCEGSWVISLDTLREMVDLAERARFQMAKPVNPEQSAQLTNEVAAK